MFITLVNEGLIDATIHKPIEELPFTSVTLRGLSRQGLLLIQELPDPNQALLSRLDEMAAAIRGLQDVPKKIRLQLKRPWKNLRISPED